MTAFGVAAATALLAGCATPGIGGAAGDPPGEAPDGQRLGSLMPGVPERDVIGQGTVLDDGSGVQLCLVVMESYPPQCHGIPLEGWDWGGLTGSETASGVTWGAYAVQGTYDGRALTVTQPPILLALYDPMASPMASDDPAGGGPGAADDSTLAEVQEQLRERLGEDLLGSYPSEGRVWAQVVWDDGTWQEAADADFGAGVVVIEPWLREVG